MATVVQAMSSSALLRVKTSRGTVNLQSTRRQPQKTPRYGLDGMVMLTEGRYPASALKTSM